MTGGMITIKTREERDRFERERKKWVERSNGSEYLMINCRSCSQPVERQKVIRVSRDHLARRKVRAETEHANLTDLVWSGAREKRAVDAEKKASCPRIHTTSLFTKLVWSQYDRKFMLLQEGEEI